MKIEHVVVLMLENRSFDHLFGYLDHPNSNFPKLDTTESNCNQSGVETYVTDTANYTLVPGPGHHHADIIEQLYADLDPTNSEPNNSGFVKNYSKQKKNDIVAKGADIMRCLSPDKIPTLTTLAKEYCICTSWFSSVPGATWPNRQFVHAATSDRKVDNKIQFYSDPTIFELLSQSGKSWSIFHDGIAQSFAFKNLWDVPILKKKRQFRSMKDFYKMARSGKLPNYSFIEPNHMGSDSNSLHPGFIGDDAYSFISGEHLVADIYTALSANFERWEKTLFIITFDEHGGFYDRVRPPKTSPPTSENLEVGFKFDRLGVRVPSILISPWIDKGIIDDTQYDHTSIIKTLRTLFAPESSPLTNRDKEANHVLSKLSRKSPRRDTVVMPSLPFLQKSTDIEDTTPELDEFQISLIKLGELMRSNKMEKNDGFSPTIKPFEVGNIVHSLKDLDAYQEKFIKDFRQ